jgi:DNA-binding response OmpR family regulator
MIRLLVADEDADAADLLADALRTHGYAVRAAYSEKQCLKLLGEFRPNLVLLLIPVAGFARQLRREVPVLDHGQVPKPVDLLVLIRLIRAALSD